MASASESRESAQAAPLCAPDATMRGWGIAEVAQWAASLNGLTSDHADVLFDNEVTGADLLDSVTKDDLLRVGMPLGPTGRIMAALAAIKIADVVAPTSDVKEKPREDEVHSNASNAAADGRIIPAFTRFRDLAACEIDPEVKRVLVTAYYSQMVCAETRAEAQGLVQAAERHPHRTTLAALDVHCNLIVDGPFQPEQTAATLYRAFSALDGAPQIIKFSRLAGQEFAVFDSLGLSAAGAKESFLVPLKFVDEALFSGRGMTGSALVMPAFICSLDAVPHASINMVLRGLGNISRALYVLHDKGWVHMDVKPGNILVSDTGDWHLTDYDSCLKQGAGSAANITPRFIPRDLSRHPRPNFDFVLLATTAIFMMDSTWLPDAFSMAHLERCIDRLAECSTLRSFPHDTTKLPQLQSALLALLGRN